MVGPKDKLSIQSLKKILFISVFIFAILFILMELLRKLDKKDFTEVNWFYINPDIGYNSSVSTGSYMMTSVITSAIAGIFYLYLAFYMIKVKKKKGGSELADLLKNICIFLSLARLIEIFYISVASEFFSIETGLFKYYLILDMIGIILFLFFCIGIFFADFPKELRETENKFVKTGLVAIYVSLFPVYAYFIHYIPFPTVGGLSLINMFVAILAGLGFLVLLIISIQITLKIMRLKKRIETNKSVFNAMSVQCQIFVILVILAAFVILYPPNTLSYFMRSIKNILFILNAYLFIPAFVKPAHEQKN